MWQTLVESVNILSYLLHNIQFYVALGTISMAATTAASLVWSIHRQKTQDLLYRIRNEMNLFYQPLLYLFRRNWEGEELEKFWWEWERIKLNIAYAEFDTLVAFYQNGLIDAKLPTVWYGINERDESELEPWEKFYKVAWLEFIDLREELHKLEKRKVTYYDNTLPPIGKFYNLTPKNPSDYLV